VVEKARRQVSDAIGASASDIVFTSGATESAALALAGRDLQSSEIEHDAVLAWTKAILPVGTDGQVMVADPGRSCVQFANGETGIVQELQSGVAAIDATQGFGKVAFAFDWLESDMAMVSAHKIRGPRGVGALIVKQGLEVAARNLGGGQEMGRRSGTENIVGIAGFGAAAQTAARDLANGVWEEIAALRDLLEDGLQSAASGSVIIGQGTRRLPNTCYLATPGWKGETQVMAMDLAGFAGSAGAACSSGKTRASRVLTAMGFDADTSRGAIRLSLGPTNTRDEVLRFVDLWSQAHKRFQTKAA